MSIVNASQKLKKKSNKKKRNLEGKKHENCFVVVVEKYQMISGR